MTLPPAGALRRPRVVLVVPCYNEAARLNQRAFVEARFDACDLAFVFVDDGSADATRTVLEGMQRERPDAIQVLAYDRNAGKAEAVRRGMLRGLSMDADYVGYWDADLATPLSELPRFVEVLEGARDVVCVLGARVKLLGRTVERHVWRHYFGRVFAMAASITLDLPVYDTQCGAKLLRTSPEVSEAFGEPFLASWVFDVELIARLRTARARSAVATNGMFYELPLLSWVDVKGSKLKPRDFVRAAFDLRRIWKAHRTRR